MGGSSYIQQKFSESLYTLRKICVLLINKNDFGFYRAVGYFKAVGALRVNKTSRRSRDKRYSGAALGKVDCRARVIAQADAVRFKSHLRESTADYILPSAVQYKRLF